MKITKYNHSCLFIEDVEKNTLIDPGSYSENIFIAEKLPKLDYLVITHEHTDHFSMPLVKKIVAAFPNIIIIATPEVVEQLLNEHIQATDKGNEYIKVQAVPHEKVWSSRAAQNIMVTIGDKLTHPGDSHTLNTTAAALALPIVAPWASTTAAIELAEKLQPKVIIPIHDFMLKDESRRMLYDWMASSLQAKGIELKKIESGNSIEL